jgi:hypothetical protein
MYVKVKKSQALVKQEKRKMGYSMLMSCENKFK